MECLFCPFGCGIFTLHTTKKEAAICCIQTYCKKQDYKSEKEKYNERACTAFYWKRCIY